MARRSWIHSEIFGTPNCGKGEPNQVERVGHASPLCKFDKAQVFGGVHNEKRNL